MMINRTLAAVKKTIRKGQALPKQMSRGRVHRDFDMSHDIGDISELSYSHAVESKLERLLIRSIEVVRGQYRLIPSYLIWRRYLRRYGTQNMMGAAYRLLKMRVEISGTLDPLVLDPDRPTVILANHPFGLLDGLAILRIAEEIGRPFKIIINKELLRVPEFRDLSLPIDFNKTREATRTNLATKNEALERIKRGEVIIIFPSGMVATSETPFGVVEELPWHNFAAKLVREGQANVLPVYFDGTNSRLFQVASHMSLTLRYAMLVGELTQKRRHVPLKLSIGDPLMFEDIAGIKDNVELTRVLRQSVLGLKDTRLPLQVHSNNGPRMPRRYQRRLRRMGLKKARKI